MLLYIALYFSEISKIKVMTPMIKLLNQMREERSKLPMPIEWDRCYQAIEMMIESKYLPIEQQFIEKQFTEEQVREAIKKATTRKYNSHFYNADEIIQSLKPKK